MSSADELALGMVSYWKNERSAMAVAAKRIIAMLDGEKIDGTSVDAEIADLVQHLGNLITFVKTEHGRLAEAKVQEIAAWLRLDRMLPGGGFDERIKGELLSLLMIPIDLSKIRSKKVRAMIQAQGFGAG